MLRFRASGCYLCLAECYPSQGATSVWQKCYPASGYYLCLTEVLPRPGRGATPRRVLPRRLQGATSAWEVAPLGCYLCLTRMLPRFRVLPLPDRGTTSAWQRFYPSQGATYAASGCSPGRGFTSSGSAGRRGIWGTPILALHLRIQPE